MHRDFGKLENLTAGKGWAVGYEPCQMAIRRKAAKHFDVRDLLKRDSACAHAMDVSFKKGGK